MLNDDGWTQMEDERGLLLKKTKNTDFTVDTEHPLYHLTIWAGGYPTCYLLSLARQWKE